MHKYHLVGYPGRECLVELFNKSYFISRKIKKITEIIDNCKKYHTSKPI
jgi:hypothetical protein